MSIISYCMWYYHPKARIDEDWMSVRISMWKGDSKTKSHENTWKEPSTRTIVISIIVLSIIVLSIVVVSIQLDSDFPSWI